MNKKGFTPLHPQIPSLKAVDECEIKFESTEKSIPLGRGETGFTLIEVLIAIFILGLGVVTLANLFPLGLQSLSYARKLNEVYFLAERKLEELKLQPGITPGESSGQEKDLTWKISIQPLTLNEGIEVNYVELEIGFSFQGRMQKQRVITYLNPA